MRLVIQRVRSASVEIAGEIKSEIGQGLMVLLGVEEQDSQQDVEWLAAKLAKMRLFSDEQDLINLSVSDIGGDILVVSQFTLYASTRKGNRPSFIRAAKGEHARALYEQFTAVLEQFLEKPVATGEFGADMLVRIENDGPVTIVIDSKDRE